jgi:predicted site-specific integrase-resolvase
MTGNNYLTQTQLAERWQVAESTLERWRSEGVGPIYMKILGRVRYRLSDITDFEEESLRGSTSQRNSTQQSVAIRSDPQDTRRALLAAANT